MPKPSARAAIDSLAVTSARRRLDGVQVVLADDHERQLPDRGEVHRLPGPPGVRAAVAHVSDGDRAGAADLGAEGRAHRQPDARPDDPIAADEAAPQVGDVHRPATTAVGPGGLAEQLGHQVGWRDAHGEGVVMAPMGARRVVAVAQRRRHADGDGLLAERRMDAPDDLAGQRQGLAAALEFADEEHAPQPVEGLRIRRVLECRRRLAARGWRSLPVTPSRDRLPRSAPVARVAARSCGDRR